MSIVVGGSKYAQRDYVTLFYTRLQKLQDRKRDASEVFEQFEGDPNALSDDELAAAVAREAGVAGLCTHLLGLLYTEIAEQYVRALTDFVRERPERAEAMHLVVGGGNTAAQRLAATRFDGIGDVRVRGWCPLAPVERLRELIAWPIDKFVELRVRMPVLPARPPRLQSGVAAPAAAASTRVGAASASTLPSALPSAPASASASLGERLLRVRSHVEALDKYYRSVCTAIERLYAHIHGDHDKYG